MRLCTRCRVNEVERIDGWESAQCASCNDRDIRRNNKRREWEEFHDEPCPENELGE